MKTPISLDKCNALEDYFSSFSRNTAVTATRASHQLQMDSTLTEDVLNTLVSIGVLRYDFVIRCPKCGLMIETVENIADIKREAFCHSCEEDFEIDASDVEVLYTLCKFPFQYGQQKDYSSARVMSAVHPRDSLARLIEAGIMDYNSHYFNPTNDQLEDLLITYNNVFPSNKTSCDLTSAAIGNSLVNLTVKLFELCKNFRVTDGLSLASGFTKKPLAQIDCYVRNELCNPLMPVPGEADCFLIECKNEAETPSGEYMKKLHSTLITTGKNYGLIISKCKAPTTFVALSNQIYLHDKIFIIWMDKFDLSEIVCKKKNLLEMLARKIDDVKLNATSDLRDLGLYDA